MRLVTRTLAAMALAAVGLSAVVRGQGGIASASARFLVSPQQVIAIRAGRLFDGRSGSLGTNQIVLIRGDRIVDVGPSVAIPPEARVIDLSAATVLPGMIDAHVHVYPQDDLSQTTRTLVAVANAEADLDAGFTTVLDMDSRGGYGTVDLRNAINRGIVLGPRMQVVGQSLNQRATTSYPSFFERFQDRFTESKNPNSPWLARAAVREAKLHGVDWVKIYTTQDFVGDEYSVFKPDGTLVNSPSLTEEEVMAVVDEAHRLGLKVACHTYGGEGQLSCLKAGVDAPNHLTDLDDASLKLLVDKKLPFELTIDDLVALEAADLRRTGGKNSRSEDGGAGVQEGKGRWCSIRLWKRRDVGRRPARQAGRPVRSFREVGDDAARRAAHAVPAHGNDAELRLGEADRQHREGEVRRSHRRLRRSARGHQRDAARAVRDEGRICRQERTAPSPGTRSNVDQADGLISTFHAFSLPSS